MDDFWIALCVIAIAACIGATAYTVQTNKSEFMIECIKLNKPEVCKGAY